MMRHAVTASIVFLVAGHALPAADGTVTGSGTAEVQIVPEIMRVRIELVAKGKDLKEALEKLKGRRDAASEKLAALGANKESISFSDAGVGTEAMNRNARMRAYSYDPRTGQPIPPKPKGPQPVFVSTAVTAEFPVKAGAIEELLLRTNALQESIKAADLGGLKEAGKMTPQEEEFAEEKGVQPTMEDGGPKPGEPVFLFIGKIDDAQREKASAEAFQKAKRQAARLARAAEGEIGEVRDVMESVGPSGSPGDYDPEMEYYARAALYGRHDYGSDTSEAVSAKAGRVSLRVGVTVKYALKPAKP